MSMLAQRMMMASAGGIVVDYLFNENFTIDQPPPLVVPFATDGVGTWDLIADGAGQEITAGVLQVRAASSYSLEAIHTDVTSGYVIVWRVGSYISGTSPRYVSERPGIGQFGFDRPTTRVGNNVGLQLGINLNQAGDYFAVQGTTRNLAIVGNILEAVGGFGGIFNVTRTEVASIFGYSVDISQVAIGKPHGNWDAIEGMRTAVIASPAGGETGDVDKDSNFYVRISTLPTTTATIAFRIQDASNRWEVNITSGGVMTLDEVVAGTPVTRITVVGVAAGEVIFCHANDEAIGLMRHVNTETMVRYTGAVNFKAETGYEIVLLGGAVLADFEAWNTHVTGEDLARLEAM